MLKNKKIFVSGGAGVIGREMVSKLIDLGAIVFVGDIKPCPLEWAGKVHYRQGDLNFITSEEVANFSPDIFIHLAATFERSSESYEFWKDNFWHNVNLSHHLMTIIKDLPSLKKVVFASSYLIYDPTLYNFIEPKDNPIVLSESDPIYPRNLTGVSKFSHEIELRFIEQFHSNQYKIVLARIFRGYGCGSRDVISRWVRSLLLDEEIIVFKKEGWFDYIYAKDTAEGLIRLASSDESTGIVNLGTGKSKRVEDIINTLKKYFPQMKIREEKSDILYEASQGDITKLIEFTGWTPVYNIEKAIPEIIEFEKNKKLSSEKFKIGNILVSSSSHKVPLIKSVKYAAEKISPEIQVFAGDLNNDVITSFVADKFWNMPKTEDDNIKDILNWCLENNIKYVIPSRDGELVFWSKYKSLFNSNGIYVMVSRQDAINRCLDKLEFSNYCASVGVPAILSYQDIDSCVDCDNLYVVKERRGAGSRSIGVKLNKIEAQKHAVNLEEPIFQPFVKGIEISADAYIDKKGEVLGIILRTRDKVVNGESQITTVINDEEIEKLLVKTIKELNLYGHIILQAIIDNNNIVQIIECNCRFGGASTLSIEAGLDSFYWFILESLGQSLDKYYFYKTKRQIKQIRVPSNLYIYGDNF